jgi:hypothetical protein
MFMIKLYQKFSSVLEIRIQLDPDLFAGSGNFDRIPDLDPTPLKVLINQKR